MENQPHNVVTIVVMPYGPVTSSKRKQGDPEEAPLPVTHNMCFDTMLRHHSHLASPCAIMDEFSAQVREWDVPSPGELALPYDP